jgi:hypothetical protein
VSASPVEPLLRLNKGWPSLSDEFRTFLHLLPRLYVNGDIGLPGAETLNIEINGWSIWVFAKLAKSRSPETMDFTLS